MRSHQTNKQYSCIEGIIEAKTMGPEPHLHQQLDEIMYVLEGTVSVLVGDKVYEIEAGRWHMRLHKMVHTFWNATDKPARMIDIYVGQDFDNFVEELLLKIFPDFLNRGISLSSQEATRKINALQARYGITSFRSNGSLYTNSLLVVR